LHRIQQFDPIGVGARDLGEYLRVQLDHLPPNTPWRTKAKDLITHYLDLLAKHDYVALKRRLGLNLEQLHEVIHCIQGLNPRPRIERGHTKTVDYVIPDVYTYKRDGKWVVVLNPECTPPITINAHYAAMIKNGTASKDHQYLRNHLQEAQWFLKSIQNRNDTLLKVARCIVAQQQAFLENGEEHMKPLVLHDIAQHLSLHESTISRVTTQKYLQTPRGTFELKFFFSSGVATDQGGECSSTAIRAHIKKLVAAENRKKPFSDSALTKLLVEQGIQVARRTVTKYREAMSIPSSHERKQRL
jgi:RNA polymerase sigma-54 factor